jgi:branched-chain amino acid transport system substrate-binding protein
MRRMRPWRLIAILLAATLVMGACGDDDDDVAGTDTTAADGARTVTIAFMGALTGDNANLGINIRDGIKLAIAEANAGDDDVQIALKEFDTAGDPAQASTVKDQVIADDDVVGVVGPAFSGETRAVIPAFEDACPW